MIFICPQISIAFAQGLLVYKSHELFVFICGSIFVYIKTPSTQYTVSV